VCWQAARDANIRLVRFLWAHHSSLLLDLIKNSADMVLPLSNLGNFPESMVSDMFETVLRIRDVYPGSRVDKILNPDPHQRIYVFFNPKNLILSSQK
jgi:hypothetical protein